jgi:hypothetical protein
MRRKYSLTSAGRRSGLAAVYVERMASAFGRYVEQFLDQHELSVRAYARLIGCSGSQPFVARVLRGLDPPPLKSLERWAKPLQLTPDQRTRFDLLAAIAHSPLLVQRWCADHDAEIARLVSVQTRRRRFRTRQV